MTATMSQHLVTSEQGVQTRQALESGGALLDVGAGFWDVFRRLHLDWLMAQSAGAEYSKKSVIPRLIRAVSWRGRAAHDLDPASGFIESVFALECLLSRSDPSDPVQPSLGSQVAEGVAFLMSDAPAERRELVQRVKRMYRLRSGIVHGSDRAAPDIEIYSAFDCSRRVILRVLSLAVNGMSTVDDLARYIDERKFGTSTHEGAQS